MARPVLLLALFCALGVASRPWLGEGYASLIFVLGISVIGAVSGLSVAVVCAVAAAAVFNYFVSEPVFELDLTRQTDFAPPIIFTLCAVISGSLSGRLRDESSRVRRSNLELESLLAVSGLLQRARDDAEVFAGLRGGIEAPLGLRLGIFRLDGEGLVSAGGSGEEPGWRAASEAVCRTRAEYRRDGALAACLLTGGSGVVGALVAQDIAGSPGAERSFMLALARVVALALERTQLAARLAEAQALARTEELKTVLLSAVSHDLRTPLTTISTSAACLQQFGSRLEGETVAQLLGCIVDESERLNHITTNLLEFTRLQSGEEGLRRSVLPAGEMIAAAIVRQQRHAGARSIAFVRPKAELQVQADTALFELVLANVLQNAIRYTAGDGAIALSCEAAAGDCVITVTDDGIGIAPALQDKVFARFYRVEHGRAAPRGTGLGLAIAKGFVEAFGGAIAITSPVADGRGTTITIRLPLAEAEMAP